MFVAVWGLWATVSLRVSNEESLALAQNLVRMAEENQSPIQRQQAHFALGVTRFRQADFAQAYDHFQEVARLYVRADHASHVAVFREDVGVTNGTYMSWVLLFLGFPEQALRSSAQALCLARELGHPFSLAYALSFAMGLHDHLRQPQAALALAQEALDLVNKHGFTRWKMGAMVAQGWALAQQGDGQGVAVIQHCVDATRASRRRAENIVLAPLADAYVGLGRWEDALRVIDEVFATGRANRDHHMDAEFFRMQGESMLLRSPSQQQQAEACFEQALAISRAHHARWFELRAATSLARLWQQQGKVDPARQLLESVVGWFTEGFSTADVRAARALLAAPTRTF